MLTAILRDGDTFPGAAAGETVKLRICLPEWATDPLLTVNGKAVTPENDGCFVCTCIKMNAGTRVGLAFPLRAVPCRRFRHEKHA